jgi:CRP-like cAMP-binding protein
MRLDNLKLLDDRDAAVLDGLLANEAERVAGEIVQAERSPVDTTRILLSGWAIRYQTTRDGRRQILNFLLPGDTIGLYGALFRTSDSAVELITDCRLAEFPSDRLLQVFEESARLGAALCWLGGQDERFLEQQILRIGVMNATARIAHLLVELQRRLMNAGIAPAEAMTIPLTQKLIADALGLSAVHVNRCCRELEKQRLLETGPGVFTLLDPEGLKQACDYDVHFTRDDAIPADAAAKLGAEPEKRNRPSA